MNSEPKFESQHTAFAVSGMGEIMSLLTDDTRFKVLYALSRPGLADYRREGRLVYYRLVDERLRPLLETGIAYVRQTRQTATH